MFYAPQLLGKKGPLGKIWLAAHWEDKVTKAQIFETNISQSVDRIMEPHVRLALRTISHLLLGVVRIYARKTGYLLTDCNEIFIKLKMAFRPDLVDLPEENIEATIKAITYQPEFHDFDVMIPELSEMDIMQQFQINQARAEAITLKEVFPISSGTEDVVDADNTFGDDEDIPDFMREFIATIGQRTDDHINGTTLTFNGPDSMPSTSNEGDKTDDIKLFEEIATSNDLSNSTTNIMCEDISKKSYEDDDDDDDHDMDFGGPPSIPSSCNSKNNSPATSPLHESTSTRPESRSNTIMSNDLCSNNINMSLKSSEDEGFASQQTALSDHLSLNSVSSMSNMIPSPIITATQIPLPSTVANATTPQIAVSTPIPSPSNSHSSINMSFNTTTTSTTTLNNTVKTKRRRKLLIDQVRNISGEEMRHQLSDTSDIVMILDMAPPSKRMMHWRATGILEKMFSLPTTEIRSNSFFEKYQKNLVTRPVEAEDVFTNTGSVPNINSDTTVFDNKVVMSPIYDKCVPVAQNNASLSRNHVPVPLLTSTPNMVQQLQPQQSPIATPPVLSPQTLHVSQSQSQSQTHNQIQTQQSIMSPLPSNQLQLPQSQFLLQNKVQESTQLQSQQQIGSPIQLQSQLSQISTLVPQMLQSPLIHPMVANNLMSTNHQQTSVIVSAMSSVPTPAITMNFNNNIPNDILHKVDLQSPQNDRLMAGHKRRLSTDDDIKTMSTSSLNRFDDLLPPPNSIMKTNYTDDVSINDMQYSDNTDLSRCNRQMENMGFTMNDIHNQSLLQNYNQPMSQATYYDSNMYEPEDQEEMFEGETEKQYLERVENERAVKLFRTVRQKLDTRSTLRFSEMNHGQNRKQVAHNFYSLLVLKKFRTLNLYQKQSYDDIHISKGDKFDDPLALQN